MGSYYVLEVGNFDPSPDTTGMKQEQLEPESDVAVPVAGEDGYFLLNTDDPSLKTDDPSSLNTEKAAYSSVPSRANYENANLAGFVATPSREVSHDTGVSSKLHPHLQMVNEEELERSGLTGYSRVKSEGRASTYENVCPPGERDVVPIPAAMAMGMAGSTRQDRRTATPYENISIKPPPILNAGRTHNHTPPVTRPEVKRSSRQRRDVYEVVPSGSLKGNRKTSDPGKF